MKVLVKKTTNLKENVREIFSEFPTLKKLKNKKVVIKPNWVSPRKSDTGVTTDFKLVEQVIVQLKKGGAKIVIAESAGYDFDPRETFRILGTDYFTKKYKVPILDTRDCPTKTVNIDGKVLKKIKVPREILGVDLIFNLPKLKTHMLTGVSFSLKNLLGLLPLEERRKAHTLGIHQAIVDLGKFFKKTAVIVDGLTAMGGCGPVFGDVIRPQVLIASESALAADLACCKILKINFKKIDHLRLAREQMEFDGLEIEGIRDFKIKKFDLPKVSIIYRGIYRSIFVLEEILSPFFKKSIVAWAVTRFGTMPFILREKVKDKKELIRICPVRAIGDDLEINFEKCRFVRCLRCYDKFPQAVRLKGFSKPSE